METRKFLVYCQWNGYNQTHKIVLSANEKSNIETFTEEVRILNDDRFGLATIIYSWSLIEE